jgi:UDP-2,4-diacetamido-2,4,6-trideoxy-beta-L-altropyranose hydrolase
LWMWANDWTVRAQSLDPAPIAWDEHVAWFAHHLYDSTSRILILEVDGLPVGQLRFDLAGQRATISYSLDGCVRGRGWGTELVERGLASLRVDQGAEITEVEAIVRRDNPASTTVFDKLGFDRTATSHAGHATFRFVKPLREQPTLRATTN